MVRLTKEQQKALAQLYRRGEQKESFLTFRRSVLPTIGCDSAVMVKWAGMWIGIERDGYAHS